MAKLVIILEMEAEENVTFQLETVSMAVLPTLQHYQNSTMHAAINDHATQVLEHFARLEV